MGRSATSRAPSSTGPSGSKEHCHSCASVPQCQPLETPCLLPETEKSIKYHHGQYGNIPMCPVVLMFFHICCVICIDMLCPCICWICMNMSSPRILPLQSPNNSSVVSHIHTMPRWLKRSRRGTSAKRSWAVPDWKVKARVSTMTSAHLDMSSLKPSDISCCRFALPATTVRWVGKKFESSKNQV